MSATPPSIAIAAPVLGGPEVMRVVLNSSSSTATPPSIAKAAPVLGGPEVVRARYIFKIPPPYFNSPVNCGEPGTVARDGPRCVEQQAACASDHLRLCRTLPGG